MAQLKVVLHEYLSTYCTGTQYFITVRTSRFFGLTRHQIKNFVFLFAQTLRGFGYDVSQLEEFLEKMSAYFADLSLDECTNTFQQVF